MVLLYTLQVDTAPHSINAINHLATSTRCTSFRDMQLPDMEAASFAV